jgi:hypothetical protein
MHHYMRDRVSYVTLFLPPVDFHSYTIMAFYLPLEVGSLSPLLCEVVHAIRPCPGTQNSVRGARVVADDEDVKTTRE